MILLPNAFYIPGYSYNLQPQKGREEIKQKKEYNVDFLCGPKLNKESIPTNPPPFCSLSLPFSYRIPPNTDRSPFLQKIMITNMGRPLQILISINRASPELEKEQDTNTKFLPPLSRGREDRKKKSKREQ